MLEPLELELLVKAIAAAVGLIMIPEAKAHNLLPQEVVAAVKMLQEVAAVRGDQAQMVEQVEVV
jgi:nitrate reductase gamma subunit